MIKQNLQAIINHYGEKAQSIVAIEELAELQKEITKSMRSGIPIHQSLKEEMADVFIMLWQLQLMYDISDDELREEIHFKIDRTLNRMKEEKKWAKKSTEVKSTELERRLSREIFSTEKQ